MLFNIYSTLIPASIILFDDVLIQEQRGFDMEKAKIPWQISSLIKELADKDVELNKLRYAYYEAIGALMAIQTFSNKHKNKWFNVKSGFSAIEKICKETVEKLYG